MPAGGRKESSWFCPAESVPVLIKKIVKRYEATFYWKYWEQSLLFQTKRSMTLVAHHQEVHDLLGICTVSFLQRKFFSPREARFMIYLP